MSSNIKIKYHGKTFDEIEFEIDEINTAMDQLELELLLPESFTEKR